MNEPGHLSLQNFDAPNSLKISLLWASLMSLYIYNDYFSLYTHGTIERMVAGQLGPLGEATDLLLLIMSIVLAIPALMIFLSVMLPAQWSRYINCFLGVVYTVIEAMTFLKSPLFYQAIVSVELVLTLGIFLLSLRWPKTN